MNQLRGDLAQVCQQRFQVGEVVVIQPESLQGRYLRDFECCQAIMVKHQRLELSEPPKKPERTKAVV